MLKYETPKALFVIQSDIGDMSLILAWKYAQHIAHAAMTSQKQDEGGKWVSLSGEERLLHLRNAILMELAGRVDDDEELWRVKVTASRVTALYVGLESKPGISVKNLLGLPEWMQQRVTVLSMLTQRPPTEPIEGVGRRITDTVYWIIK